MVRQELVDPLQLIFILKIDLYPATLALAHDSHARAQRETQLLFGGTCVDILRRILFLLLWLERLLHHRLGLAHREIARHDLA